MSFFSTEMKCEECGKLLGYCELEYGPDGGMFFYCIEHRGNTDG